METSALAASAFIEEIAVPKAEDLVAALRLTHDRWHPEPSMWCFRGEDRASYEGLVPSVLRPGAFDDWHTQMKPPDLKRSEWLAINEYLRAVDEAGLPIPYDSHAIREITSLADLVFDKNNAVVNWPPDQLLGISALAQHYGIPTRLLDWSWKPLVACYFATAHPARGRDSRGQQYASADRMVVWALRAFWLPFVQQVGSEPKRFAVVTTPKATNPNLAAQAGVFTLDRGAQKGIGFAKALEGALGATLPTFESAMMPIFGFTTPLLPFMYRFTLPHSEAGRLLRVLSLEGVSAAAVYPGHKGVADSLWERRHHRP